MNKGHNVKRLIIAKMAADAVCDQAKPFEAGWELLCHKGKLMASAHEATVWVRGAIDAVKQTTDNPYGDDDEAIAGAILDELRRRDGDQQKTKN